eukprot:COSAG02_NODE_14492_length_1266_cov_1.704370_1_plen_264_part_10
MQRMMDEDEKKVEMKRQHTIIAAQGAGTKAIAKAGVQQALDGGVTGIAKKLGWDIDLGLNGDKDAMDVLWKKVDYNASNSATFGELKNGILEACPQLLNAFQGGRASSRVIMRAYKAADIVAARRAQKQQPPGTTKSQENPNQGDGLITRTEFPRFLAYVEFFANLWEHFEILDADANGKLDLAEFKSAFHNIMPKVRENRESDSANEEIHVSAQEIDKFLQERFAECDTDHSGYCSFDEFSAWIAAHSHEKDDKKKICASTV